MRVFPHPPHPFPLVRHVTPPAHTPRLACVVSLHKDTRASSGVEAAGEGFYLAEMEGWQSG